MGKSHYKQTKLVKNVDSMSFDLAVKILINGNYQCKKKEGERQKNPIAGELNTQMASSGIDIHSCRFVNKVCWFRVLFLMSAGKEFV